MKDHDFEVYSPMSNGIKKSRFRTRARPVSIITRFSVYVAKSDENMAFRLPFIVITLGLIFSFISTLITNPSRSVLISLQDLLFFGVNPSLIPLFGIMGFLGYIYIENFEEFNIVTILVSWVLAGFLVGLVNGSTRGEGILIQMLRSIVRMMGILLLVGLLGYLFASLGGFLFDDRYIDIGFSFLFLLTIGFAFLILIPLSFVAAFGFTLGERFYNE